MKKIGWQRLLAGAVLIVALMACGIFPQSVPLIQQVFPTQTPLTFNNFSTSTPLPNVTQSPLTTTLSTSKNPVTYLPIEQTFINVYEQVDPSVVHIRVVLKSSSTNPFPNFQLPNIPGLPFQNQPTPQAPDTAPDQAIGSGFIIDTNGHIVTNNHVIDGADRIIVTFADGSSAAGKVVGADPDSDLAVIQVNANPSLLKPVVFGDSDALKVGQMVVAIGNPFGLQNSMTTGIISGLGRLLPTDTQNTTGSSYSIPDIIQTDAPINPGNSGGPLLTLDGSIVGVNTAIESPVRSSSGVGYAVPVSIVKKVVPVLIQKGSYQHPWIGISGVTMSADLAQAMKLDPNQRGVLVVTVNSNSPAGKAGLHPSTNTISLDGVETEVGGDVIVGIDSLTVKQFDDLLGYIVEDTTVGQTVTLHILRDGKSMDVNMTMEARPKASP